MNQKSIYYKNKSNIHGKNLSVLHKAIKQDQTRLPNPELFLAVELVHELPAKLKKTGTGDSPKWFIYECDHESFFMNSRSNPAHANALGDVDSQLKLALAADLLTRTRTYTRNSYSEDQKNKSNRDFD